MDRRDFNIVIIDNDLGAKNATARALGEIIARLKENEFSVAEALTGPDGLAIFLSHTMCCSILIDWDLAEEAEDEAGHPATVIEGIRQRNDKIPIFIITSRHTVQEIPPDVMNKVNGYLWVLEDTPHFIAGRVEQAAATYINGLMPPFFNELAKYVNEYKYAWHTPGHSPGSICLYCPKEKVLFSGDTVFAEGVGRTDVPGGDPQALSHSLDRLAKLKVDKILPGHGEPVLNGGSSVIAGLAKTGVQPVDEDSLLGEPV